MKLSQMKTNKTLVNSKLFALHETLLCYRNTFHFEKKYFDCLNFLIEMCEKDLYPEIPSKNGVELYYERMFIETDYKEIL